MTPPATALAAPSPNLDGHPAVMKDPFLTPNALKAPFLTGTVRKGPFLLPTGVPAKSRCLMGADPGMPRAAPPAKRALPAKAGRCAPDPARSGAKPHHPWRVPAIPTKSLPSPRRCQTPAIPETCPSGEDPPEGNPRKANPTHPTEPPTRRPGAQRPWRRRTAEPEPAEARPRDEGPQTARPTASTTRCSGSRGTAAGAPTDQYEQVLSMLCSADFSDDCRLSPHRYLVWIQNFE